ncbi:hypothetical protein [Kitasatospora sp. NPDC004272]
MDPDPDLDLELSTLMETSVEDLCVPVAVIVAESGRRGRRRRLARRRRIAGTALAVAAVTLVGADLGLPLIEAAPRPAVAPAAPPTAPASGGPSDGATGSVGADTGGPLKLPELAPLGRPAPTGKLAEEDLKDFSESSAMNNLEEMSPGSVAGIRHSWPSFAGALFLYRDADHREGALELTLHRADRPFPGAAAPLSALQSQFQCDRTTPVSGNRQRICTYGYLPDGSWEMVEADDIPAYGIYGYRVAVWRPSGLVVRFTEYCGTVDNRGVIVGNGQLQPPIALDTWRALAESPSWEYYRPVEADHS